MDFIFKVVKSLQDLDISSAAVENPQAQAVKLFVLCGVTYSLMVRLWLRHHFLCRSSGVISPCVNLKAKIYQQRGSKKERDEATHDTHAWEFYEHTPLLNYVAQEL